VPHLGAYTVVDAIDATDAAKGCRAAASTTTKPKWYILDLQQHVKITAIDAVNIGLADANSYICHMLYG